MCVSPKKFTNVNKYLFSFFRNLDQTYYIRGFGYSITAWCGSSSASSMYFSI